MCWRRVDLSIALFIFDTVAFHFVTTLFNINQNLLTYKVQLFDCKLFNCFSFCAHTVLYYGLLVWCFCAGIKHELKYSWMNTFQFSSLTYQMGAVEATLSSRFLCNKAFMRTVWGYRQWLIFHTIGLSIILSKNKVEKCVLEPFLYALCMFYLHLHQCVVAYVWIE